MIKKMKPDLGECLAHLLKDNSIPFQVCSFRYDYYLSAMFMKSTRKNLTDIKQKYCNQIDDSLSKKFDSLDYYPLMLQNFLICVNEYTGYISRSNHAINDFIMHGSSIVVRTSNLSFFCWFMKMNR